MVRLHDKDSSSIQQNLALFCTCAFLFIVVFIFSGKGTKLAKKFCPKSDSEIVKIEKYFANKRLVAVVHGELEAKYDRPYNYYAIKLSCRGKNLIKGIYNNALNHNAALTGLEAWRYFT